MEQLTQKVYTLFVQKQLGTLGNSLTLDLNFGNNIVSAKPSEDVEKQGDSTYQYLSDLSVDRSFEVRF
jgi:hypothetical protein